VLDKKTGTRRCKNLATENSFTPLLSFTLGWTIHPVKKHYCSPDFRMILISFITKQWKTEVRNSQNEALAASLKEEAPRRPPHSAPLISSPDYMYTIFSVREVTVLLKECFYIRLLWIETSSILQLFVTLWEHSNNERKLQQFPDIAWLYCDNEWQSKILLHHTDLFYKLP